MTVTSFLVLFGQGEGEQGRPVRSAEHPGDEPFDPAAPSGRHGDVLPPADAVGTRAAVMAASALEAPQVLPGAGVERVEVPARLAGEHEVTRRDQYRRAHRDVRAPAPHLPAGGRVEGAHRSEI